MRMRISALLLAAVLCLCLLPAGALADGEPALPAETADGPVSDDSAVPPDGDGAEGEADEQPDDALPDDLPDVVPPDGEPAPADDAGEGPSAAEAEAAPEEDPAAPLSDGEEPASVPAEEPAAAAEEEIFSGSFRGVNPRYEGLVDPVEPAVWPLAADGAAAEIPSFASAGEAAAYLRGKMVQRAEEIRFSCPWPGTFDETTVNEYLDSILDAAQEHTGVPTEGDYLAYQFGGYAYGWRGSGHTLTATIYLSYYTDAAQEAALDARIAQVLAQLSLDGRSNYEKVKAIRDYIVSHVEYDNYHLGNANYLLQYTAYAALMNGTAVCQGYALLTYRLLLEAGIDCRIVDGAAYNGEETGPHAWNIVQLGGAYYYADVTWDDGTRSYKYFLKHSYSDHWLSDEYAAADFRAAYPMAARDYTAGTNDQNPADTVTFDANGGETPPAALEKAHGVAVRLPDAQPARWGYLFRGWAESADASVPSLRPGDYLTGDGDRTLWAVWEPCPAGDTDGDGVHSVMDLVRLLRYVSGDGVELAVSGDVNNDERVDTADLLRLLKYLTGYGVTLYG